jgi:hypothetical protein
MKKYEDWLTNGGEFPGWDSQKEGDYLREIGWSHFTDYWWFPNAKAEFFTRHYINGNLHGETKYYKECLSQKRGPVYMVTNHVHGVLVSEKRY